MTDFSIHEIIENSGERLWEGGVGIKWRGGTVGRGVVVRQGPWLECET